MLTARSELPASNAEAIFASRFQRLPAPPSLRHAPTSLNSLLSCTKATSPASILDATCTWLLLLALLLLPCSASAALRATCSRCTFTSLFLSTYPRLSLLQLWWHHAQCWSVTDPDPPRISPPHQRPFWCTGCLVLRRVACVSNSSTLVTGVDSRSNFHSSFSPSSVHSCASSTLLSLSRSSQSLASSLFPSFILSPSNSHSTRVLVYSWRSSGAPQAFSRAPSLLLPRFSFCSLLVLFLLFLLLFRSFPCDFTAHSWLPGPELLSSAFCAPPSTLTSLSCSS